MINKRTSLHVVCISTLSEPWWQDSSEGWPLSPEGSGPSLLLLALPKCFQQLHKHNWRLGNNTDKIKPGWNSPIQKRGEPSVLHLNPAWVHLNKSTPLFIFKSHVHYTLSWFLLKACSFCLYSDPFSFDACPFLAWLVCQVRRLIFYMLVSLS